MAERKFSQPSVMSAQQHFSNVPKADIPRSKFDRSHGYKTTFDAGGLYPIFVDEVLPGDTFNLKSTAFARLATPLKPVMDNMYLDTHYFFVPYRLVWDNWQNFMGERPTPDFDPSTLSMPQTQIDLASIGPNYIANYFGLPLTTNSTSVSVSALPFRAYGLIWNEWYRDENLQNPLNISMDDGPDIIGTTNFAIQPRGKRKDYFTSALPWPQKGDPVLIPLGVEAPITGLAVTQSAAFAPGTYNLRESDGKDVSWTDAVRTDDSTPSVFIQEDPDNPGYPNVYADLTEASAVSINDLRTAFQIQRLLERDARGGTRYIEIILSHFGVVSDDARLQRPEYLGGGTTMININPVASTVSTTEQPQADLAATGTALGKAGFTKSFTEHGIIIGLVSARADLTYQNGIDRFWSRSTRYDFYWPALAHLGEQAILNKEIFVSGTSADNEAFGYQERYAEYRYKPSRITGKFASNDPESLDVWHLSQDFSTLPVLNGSFIQDNPPIDRIIAVPSEPHFIMDVWFRLHCDRPMPIYSVPGLVDHF